MSQSPDGEKGLEGEQMGMETQSNRPRVTVSFYKTQGGLSGSLTMEDGGPT